MKSPKPQNESLTVFQPVIDALTSQIAILDERALVVAVNQSWQQCAYKNKLPLLNAKTGDDYLKICDQAASKNLEGAGQLAVAIRKIQKSECIEAYVEYDLPLANKRSWFQVKVSRFNVGQGEMIVIHQDITEKKETEEKFFENERLFRSIIEQASEGIAIIDQDGKIIEWNAAEIKITGRSRESVLGRYIWDVQHESYIGTPPAKLKEIMKAAIIKILQGESSSGSGKPSEVEIARPDGTHVIIENIIFPIVHDHGNFACSLTRDITEIKESLISRQLLEQKLENYVDYSPVIAFIITTQGKFVDVNPEARKRLGYKKQEFLEMTLADLISQEDMDYSVDLLHKLLEKKNYSADICIKNKRNKKLTLSANGVVLPDGNLMILCTDITDLKESQIKLQESESFLSNILDNIPSMITVKKAEDLSFYKVNKHMEEFLGLKDQKIKGKTVQDFFPKNEADFDMEQDRLAIKEHRILDIPIVTSSSKYNSGKIFDEKKIPLYDNDENPSFLLTVIEDITAQVGLESEAKKQLARLEVISQLSTRLQTIPSLEEVMPVLLDLLMPLVSAEMGSIWLYSDEREVLVPVYMKRNGRGNEKITWAPLKPGEGILGKVFVTKKPYFSENYADDPWFAEEKKQYLEGNFGGIFLPLRTTKSIIGVINLTLTNIKNITEDDIKLMTTLSEIAGTAIQNISLREQTEQRLTRLTALSSIDRAISSSLDLQVSLEILVSNVISQLHMDAASILLFNPFSKLLEFTAGQGFLTNAIEATSLGLGEHLAGKAAMTRELVQVKNLEEYPEKFVNPQLDAEGFVTYYGIPLIAKGQIKGVMEVFNRTQHEPDTDWINFLRSLAEQAAIAIDNMQMFEDLHRSNIELTMAYNATIEGWSRALDLRDKETEGHTQRVTELTERLAKAFSFPENQFKYIRWGALLHDIGKLGVPDGILLKPGPLTDEEWKIMKMHPRYAFEMLAPIGYLKQAVDIPYCHHEKWDGTGYPRGLKGEEIPLAARIFAVVDIWDALHSDRPYRKAWSTEKILEYLKSISGTHLDPKVVDFCLKTGIFAEHH